MLSEALDLGKINATDIFDTLYQIFYRDFVANRTYLAGKIYINPRSHRKEDGKEQDFWHLTTRENSEKEWVNGKLVWRKGERYLDFPRASRLEWVKQILINHEHESLKCFYHRETNAKRNIRFYLWAYQHDFVVILQKLGRTDAYLVTSFYITHDGKRHDFQARYEKYINNDSGLAGCEWF